MSGAGPQRGPEPGGEEVPQAGVRGYSGLQDSAGRLAGLGVPGLQQQWARAPAHSLDGSICCRGAPVKSPWKPLADGQETPLPVTLTPNKP